jgi:tRNA-dihydrouridine synthase A
MQHPALVADCVKAMKDAVDVDVTVKCRIGVDDQDPEVVLPDFLEQISAAGVERVTIHARKAWLQGLSPKENRDIPPLDYDLVKRMKQQFPHLHVSINGGIADLDLAQELLDSGLDGVMIGRAAYHQPWDILGTADARIFGVAGEQTADEVVRRMLPFIETHLSGGGKLHQVTRHMLGIFAGRPGARRWRQILSTGATRTGAGTEVVEEALRAVTPEQAA